METTDPGRFTVARAEHPVKAPSAILVIPTGNRIRCRNTQREKARSPIDMTLLGNQIEVSEHTVNAFRRIILSRAGNCTAASESQKAKALLPIDVTVSGIRISLSSVQCMKALAGMATTESAT
jgi:hypothetical protein